MTGKTCGKITADFEVQLKARIALLEKECAVQFVPVFRSRSSRYLTFQFAVAWALALIAIPILWFVESRMLVGQLAHSKQLLWHLWFALSPSILFLALCRWPWAARQLLPRSLMQHAVEEQASKDFLNFEIFATRRRVGVLILVSDFEHAVFLLGDRGFAAHIKNEEWSGLASQLAADFSAKNPGASFFQALDQLAERLKQHYPPELNNEGNELPDNLRRL